MTTKKSQLKKYTLASLVGLTSLANSSNSQGAEPFGSASYNLNSILNSCGPEVQIDNIQITYKRFDESQFSSPIIMPINNLEGAIGNLDWNHTYNFNISILYSGSSNPTPHTSLNFIPEDRPSNPTGFRFDPENDTLIFEPPLTRFDSGNSLDPQNEIADYKVIIIGSGGRQTIIDSASHSDCNYVENICSMQTTNIRSLIPQGQTLSLGMYAIDDIDGNNGPIQGLTSQINISYSDLENGEIIGDEPTNSEIEEGELSQIPNLVYQPSNFNFPTGTRVNQIIGENTQIINIQNDNAYDPIIINKKSSEPITQIDNLENKVISTLIYNNNLESGNIPFEISFRDELGQWYSKILQHANDQNLTHKISLEEFCLGGRTQNCQPPQQTSQIYEIQIATPIINNEENMIDFDVRELKFE